jgi:ribosomal protein S18 acetylase RimI-like enzyme
MTTILSATSIDAELLSKIGKQTFLESHGHSASKKDIANYVASKFSVAEFVRELNNIKNHYYVLYYSEQPVGYAKIVFNVTHKNISSKHVTKLERLYVLQEFHHLKLGLKLFNFCVSVSKKEQQTGLWLYTWVENHKAIQFYEKAGFNIVGNYDFKISETHYNPNHQMLLTYNKS